MDNAELGVFVNKVYLASAGSAVTPCPHTFTRFAMK
jgi:hypothetical protein